MRQKHFYILLIIFMGMFLPLISRAQTPPPNDPVDAPIDGGLSLLLAAGVGYGVKKAYAKRKKTNDEVKDVNDK